MKPSVLGGFLVLAFALGVFLRLDQIMAQVLTNDEWHPVHHLIWHRPGSFIRSLGNADYSIPLVLFYWVWMKWFPLTELVLRMPMIIAGILTLVAFPLALRKHYDDRIVAVFAVLLATSPFVISYARIARPYAITLFGIYVSYALLARALADDGRRVRWKWGVGWAFVCGLVLWLHAVSGPMLVAPLAHLGWTTLRRKGISWRALFLLTALAGVFMALAVVPPLLGDPAALAAKSGHGTLELDGWYGALFLWFGTGSTLVLFGFVVLSIFGVTALSKTPLTSWAVTGVGLTLLLVVVMRPTDIQRPIVLARYVLPIVPLVLLAAAVGIVRASDDLRNLSKRGGPAVWAFALAAPLIIALVMTSPTPELVCVRPSSYTQDSFYQYDYRKELNPIRRGFQIYPTTGFWAAPATMPPDTMKIAVAPFRYSTWEYPAPIWERASHQRIIPAYSYGACEDWSYGEVPPEPRFHFRNASHFDHWETLVSQGVDYLAYYLMPAKEWLSPPRPECVEWLRTYYPPPDYEDSVILVWRINPDAPLPDRTKVTQ